MRALALSMLVLVVFSCSPAPMTGGSGGGSSSTGGGSNATGGGSSGTGGGSAGGTSSTGGGTAQGPTWYEDVLPIVQQHCQGCHVAGGIAPFELVTYASAKTHHPAMAAAVSSRRMPPWMPADNCGDFRDNRRLAQADIDLIGAWSNAGAPEGNPANAPPAPDAGMGTLTDPSVVLSPPAAYTPNGTLSDDYRCFIVDPGLTADRDVVAYEIEPGQRALVHHVLLYTGTMASAQQKDMGEAGEGWTCFGGPGVGGMGLLGGWAPGAGAVRYPGNTGIRFKAGDVIAMQVHYNTTAGALGPDMTRVKLKYADGAVTRAQLVPLVDQNFQIPPNAMDYTPPNHPMKFPTLNNAKIWGVLPHMHTLGKAIKMEYDNTCLVNIPAWDFHWQQGYYFNQPVTTTFSTDKLRLTCTWNNTTNRMIQWGENTTDEMCLGYVYFTTQ